MNQYTPQKFDLPELDGISKEQIDAHIALYEGYVKHTNTIIEKIHKLCKAEPQDSYLMQELDRRFGFEFDGMRLHEYYFGALQSGPTEFDPQSAIGEAIARQYGDFETFIDVLTRTGMTRGSGWVLLYWDSTAEQFIIHWADEHHLGHLATLPVVLALDCWEHAYMIDHDTTGRKKYIESYLANLNWKVIDELFQKCQ